MRRILVMPAVAILVLLLGSPFADADDGGLARARDRAQRAAQELADAESRLGELDREITDLEARASDARERIAGLEGAVQEATIEQFIGAGSEQVALVDPDLNRQVRADALARSVTREQQDAIEAYLAAVQDLDAASETLADRRADQEDAVSELRSRRARLDTELRRLESLERQRQEEERRRRAEEERRRQEEERAAEIRAAQAAAREQATTTSQAGTTSTRRSTTTGAPTTAAPTTSAPSAPSGPQQDSRPTGEWICPVQGPHTFVDTWGAPRSGGRRHQGVDMMAARGTPTVAPVAGRVEHRGNAVGGLSWHLYGDDGNFYYGTHLAGYANQGTGWVEAGTLIGYVGDTGNAAGNPHLHFEIHPNGGAAVNPYPTVARYCR